MKIALAVTVEFERIVVVEADSISEAIEKASNDTDLEEWVQKDIASDPSDGVFRFDHDTFLQEEVESDLRSYPHTHGYPEI